MNVRHLHLTLVFDKDFMIDEYIGTKRLNLSSFKEKKDMDVEFSICKGIIPLVKMTFQIFESENDLKESQNRLIVEPPKSPFLTPEKLGESIEKSSEEFAKKINVKIIQGINFPGYNLTGTADLFVNVTIGKSKKKTQVKNTTCNPVWNEQLDFDIENEDFNEIILEVMNWSITKNELIDTIKLSKLDIEFDRKYSTKITTKKELKEPTMIEFIFYLGKEEEKKQGTPIIKLQNFIDLVKGNNTQNYVKFLKKVTLFQSMNDNERLIIAKAFKKNKYKANQDIIKEFDEGDDFHIILEGQCKVWKNIDGKRVDLVTLKRENYFGELALLYHQPRAATVTAVGNVETISLDNESFKLLLGPIENILKRNEDNYEFYMKKIQPK